MNEELKPCPDCGSPLEDNGCCSDVGSNNCQYLEGTSSPPCHNECYENVNNNVQCGTEKGGYHCSRLPNHNGKHVACAVEHGIFIWENDI